MENDYKVANEHEQMNKFDIQRAKMNAKAGKTFGMLCIFLETCLIIYALLSKDRHDRTLYIYMYLIMCVLSLSMLFLGGLFVSDYAKNYRKMNASAIVYAALFLIWGGALGVLDLKNGYSETIVFLTIVFAVSGTLYIKPLNFALLLGAAFAAFLTAVSVVPWGGVRIELYVNMLVYYAVALIFCAVRYRGFLNEYSRRLNYIDMNNRLKELYEHQQRTNEALKRVSCTDALTGINNRWGLHFIFDKELADCRDRGVPLTVMMFDLDNFKNINDTLGHKAGDESLVKVSKIFSAIVTRDCVFRYGGEEFIVLLKELPPGQTLEIAEKIREEVAGLEIGGLPITVSGGVYNKVPGKYSDSDEYLVGADQALYKAKTAGKNKVILNA